MYKWDMRSIKVLRRSDWEPEQRKWDPICTPSHFFAFFLAPASSASTPLFPASLELFLDPSAFGFSFFAAPATPVFPLPAVFFSTAAGFDFFALVFALGFLFSFSSLSLFADGDSDFSSSLGACFSSTFFLPLDLGCGAPFLGSFLEPGEFSYEPPFFSYSLESLAAWVKGHCGRPLSEVYQAGNPSC